MRRSEKLMIARAGEMDFYAVRAVSRTRPRRLALYARVKGERPLVLYKRDLPEVKLREILEEEIAHHDLRCGMIYKEDTDSARYEERRARSLALQRMVTPEAIAAAIENGAATDEDIADALDVSMETLVHGVEKLRRQHPRGRLLVDSKTMLTLSPLAVLHDGDPGFF